jgi:phage-related protein
MSALPYPEKISYASSPKIKDSVSILPLGDNYQQRIEIGLNPQHEEWSIIYPALNDSEFQTVLTLLNTVRCVTPLTWVSPLDGVTKKYTVVPDSRSATSVGIKWSLSLSLRQVFEP